MKKPTWRSAIAIGMVVVSASMLTLSVYTESKLKTDLEKMNGDVAELHAQIDSRLVEDDLPDIEVIEEKLVSCADIGNKIADIQNDMIYREGMSVDAYSKAVQEKLAPLKNYIDNSNLKALSYWFAPSRAEVVSYKWSFETGYKFHTIRSDGTRADPKVPVLWICREMNTDGSDGPILMYVRGTMDFDKNIMSIPGDGIGVKCMTMRGYRYVSGELTGHSDDNTVTQAETIAPVQDGGAAGDVTDGNNGLNGSSPISGGSVQSGSASGSDTGLDDSVQWQPPMTNENSSWIDANGVIQTDPIESTEDTAPAVMEGVE